MCLWNIYEQSNARYLWFGNFGPLQRLSILSPNMVLINILISIIEYYDNFC